MEMMIEPIEIKRTYERIGPLIRQTPLAYSQVLSQRSGARVYLKMEQMQLTGSFKIRGVLSKVLGLNKDQLKRTFVAASTGNHAVAFGYAAEKYGFNGVLFLPENTTKAKLKAIEKFKVEIRFWGYHSAETEAKAAAFAKDTDGILVHPYNDPEIIKGQGTIGAEIKEQLPYVDAVLVPVGGGGLASGLGLYFSKRNIDIVGCQPKNAAEMYQSIQCNGLVPASTLATIADASAGGIAEDAITFDICRKHISGFEIIEEEAIREALVLVMKHHQVTIEPTAALPIAALMNTKKYRGKNVVLILTGKRINESLLTEITNQHGNDH